MDIEKLSAEGDAFLLPTTKGKDPLGAARSKYQAAVGLIEKDALAQRKKAEAEADAEAVQARKDVAVVMKEKGADATKIEAAQASIEPRIVLPQTSGKKQQQALLEAEEVVMQLRQREADRLSNEGASVDEIAAAVGAIKPEVLRVKEAREHPWWDRLHDEKLFAVETAGLVIYKLIMRARSGHVDVSEVEGCLVCHMPICRSTIITVHCTFTKSPQPTGTICLLS